MSSILSNEFDLLLGISLTLGMVESMSKKELSGTMDNKHDILQGV
jgi:hypothetical protein